MDEIKAFLRKPSGSGVYVRQTSLGPKVVIVYSNGYLCDWPVKYDNGKVGTDVKHSATTLKAVDKAFKFLEHMERIAHGNNN